MTSLVDTFIAGAPCTSNNKTTRDAWKASVREQTAQLQTVAVACRLHVEFHLTAEAYVTRPRFGADLDNLLKPFMDALCDTILRPLGDECVLELHALKLPATTDDLAGANLKIDALPNPQAAR